MPWQIKYSTHSLEHYFYICKSTPFVGARLLWVSLVPETNGYFNQKYLIYFFIAIALAFGIFTVKSVINTNFHLKPFAFSI